MRYLLCHQPWNDLSQSRQRWNHVVNELLAPIGDRIIESLQVPPNARLLDVATGTGEPGLTLAARYPACHIVGADLSENMLKIAGENSSRRGLSNFSTCLCDAMALPFSDNTFDGVLCRNGVMFFNDIGAGLSEMQRVLNPGCKMTVSTWGMLDKNLWIAMVLDAARDITGKRLYNNHIPGMFFCMQSGFMTDWFEDINMKEITEEELTGIIAFNSADEHWEYVTTVSAAVVNALGELTADVRQQIKERVSQKITTHIVKEKLYFQWTARITSGRKS